MSHLSSVSAIAQRLGATRSQVTYCILKLGIREKTRDGRNKLFAPQDVARIAAAIGSRDNRAVNPAAIGECR